MNDFEIVIHPDTVTDIDDIACWCFVRSPQAELQFHHKLDAAISKLAKKKVKNTPSGDFLMWKGSENIKNSFKVIHQEVQLELTIVLYNSFKKDMIIQM